MNRKYLPPHFHHFSFSHPLLFTSPLATHMNTGHAHLKLSLISTKLYFTRMTTAHLFDFVLYCSSTGQKPEVNCSRNSTNCTCQVSGYPFPSVSKVVNGNQTIRLGHGINPIAIQQGVILFAFNSFGDDVFTCPVHMVTTTKIPTTTATTTIPTTTATTISSTTFSTTQTTSAKSTNRSTTRG